jgi:hypothetical protein
VLAPFIEFLGQLRTCRRNVGDHDLGTFAHEVPHRGLPDPARATGDDRDLVLQLHWCLFSIKSGEPQTRQLAAHLPRPPGAAAAALP